MINNFKSPQSNDPIKKLQNLLNNCLYSVVDVLSNLSYQGDPKELEVVPEEESEYAYFVNLLKERAADIEREAQENEEAVEEVQAEVKGELEEEVKAEVKEKLKEEAKEEVKEEEKEEAQEENNTPDNSTGDGDPVKDGQTDESKDSSSEETGDESYTESGGLSDGQSNVDTMDRKGTDDEQTQRSVEEGPPKKYFVKPYFETPLREEILDRVERMNLILKMIDSCIEELPDSLMIEEEKCQEIKALQKRKDDSKEELKRLYSEYDAIYSYVSDNLRDIIINME
ncbi:hypothetical protein C922_04117 [Plasmodium inui San Antonio 1]|uniref:Uncharacterized protein n=1 Tax=Plasmodium inui San Antonio 1 TaxID=1237626 RepID=W6ZX52_9APIC|nr:hypothetical protein C922_04117 [Plasmodium inui San Antonio 1]EUD65377.1 hypothetical protein C922_04117 [Plasmodium inui San Antonio 1]